MENNNVIYGINGPVVTVKNTDSFEMMEMVHVGKQKLVGEIIGITDDITTIQVYEETTGLKPGDPVEGTGAPMNVLLGPGIIDNIFDGIERPLKAIEEEAGAFINRGSSVSALDDKKLWNVTMKVKVGDKLDLIIMKTNDQEGTMMLSKRRYDAAKAWDELSEESDQVVEGTVTGVVGDGKGLFVQYGGIRVFIPASLAKANRSDSLEDMVKTTVKFKIIEVDKKRKRVVGSIRAVAKEERKAAEEKFWAQAEEGQVYHGVVRSLTSYGAFVDLGGVDGMIHISELSWTRIKHPSDVVKVGDTVEVYIKALDRENKKISLGYKKVEDNPWEILKRDYPVGTECEAKIVGLTTFGAFANILPGIDGLIHISEIAHEHIANPAEVLKVGDTVKVKILDVDFDKKRVSLSRKALLDAPVADEAPAEEEKT